MCMGQCVRVTDHTTWRNNAASVSVCAQQLVFRSLARSFNQSTTVAMQCVCTVAHLGRPRSVAVAAA